MKISFRIFAVIIFFTFYICKTTAQTNIDSLLRIFNTNSLADTSRANALHKIAENFADNDPDTTIILAEQVIKFAKEKKLLKHEADGYQLVSHSYYIMGDNAKALDYTSKVLEIREKLGDKKGIARCLTNIGLLYSNESDYVKAMDAYMKALKLSEEVNDRKGLAKCYNNIGIVYNNQSDYPSATSYFLKALKINEEIGNKSAAHNNYSNLGVIYQRMGDFSKAEEYLKKALELAKETGEKKKIGESYANFSSFFDERGLSDKALELIVQAAEMFESIGYKYGLSSCYTTIGNIYMDKKDFHKALDYGLKALKIKEEIDDKIGIAICYLNLSSLYNYLGNLQLALDYAHKSVIVSKEINDIDNERLAYKNLSDFYSEKGKYKEAYENHLHYTQLSDTIFNKENSKQMSDLKTRFEVEKKEIELNAEAQLEKSRTEARSEQEKMQRYALYIVLGLTVVFGLFMFKRYKESQQQKQIIELKNKETEAQKAIIEEHQKETIDSINYAKRIQYALLANKEFLEKRIPEHFVLFNPKDIVSGDFYWAAEHNNKFYLAVCDSTGHGVPGAFMSLLNIGFLNEAIKEKDISKPHEVLNFVRKRLIETIGNDGRQDGMDAVLVCFDLASGKILPGSISYSAANTAPLVVRGQQIIELSKDKMPVGKGEKMDSFSHYTFILEKDDNLYLYTDGYVDQFGGPKGKKFKNKQLQDLLTESSTLASGKQMEAISGKFSDWKGSLEQVDDVCVIGIKL